MEEYFYFILNDLAMYLSDFFYATATQFTVITIVLLSFIVISFFDGIHQLIPDFIKERYASPPKYLSWLAVSLCVTGFYKVNIESGNLAQIELMSGGNLDKNTAIILSLIPSATYWLYYFGVLSGPTWQNVAHFALGCDFIFSMAGISRSWNISINSSISTLIATTLIVGLCSVIGEMYIMDFLTQEHKKMQERIKKSKDKKAKSKGLK